MSEILLTASEPALSLAIEANFTEEMACFARNLPGAILHDEPEITWFFLNPTGPNGVLHAQFETSDPEMLTMRITKLLTSFQEQQASGLNWRVTPNTKPELLTSLLQQNGFAHRETQTCMILSASSITTPATLPPGLQIREVRTLAELQQKCDIEQIGFEASNEVREQYYQAYTGTGIGPDSHFHHYIAWLHEEPVAVSALLLHRGVAGIYGITTLPTYRRQGIANALTLYTVQEAQRLGYQFVTLSPTKMSHALYRRLGFTDYCQFHHYYHRF
ncbi:GNAT family N-acetyltransferase [Tengunoibacter tsumagoiensis]|uniref:N-acetyltransferase domain-containing protein n=1 Tax=Tengunoibacter tsumagoiensis TaxID=2014871 RepID=A0A402A2W0_9CHLR|nr:GNAT family N-acetyltransferase [Tengunoibacter tsumagoiensis]GCE13483.1 hypothetical protein KTT_33420 [Tengunoibacter tsumagoiensis]